MRASILKLRGVALTHACPVCGSDTMRTAGGAIGRVWPLLGLRQRWCRKCLRQWISKANLPHREENLEPPTVG